MRPNGKTRVFRKGKDVITTTCIWEVTGIDLTTLYYRCANWEKREDLDADYLFRPVDLALKEARRGAGQKGKRGYIKGDVRLTNACIMETVLCSASSAATRGKKWEAVQHLDLDWVFRPIDMSYSHKKKLIDLDANANIKEEEPVKVLSEKEELYQKELRKHKGIPEGKKKEGPFFDLLKEARTKLDVAESKSRNHTRMYPLPSEVQY